MFTRVIRLVLLKAGSMLGNWSVLYATLVVVWWSICSCMLSGSSSWRVWNLDVSRQEGRMMFH